MTATRRDFLIGTGATLFGSWPARAAAPSIDEAGFVRIGGIEQWISIRGRNNANPALLFLHGGPAQPQSLFPTEFESWEADFNIIRWDQRGSGKTFGKNGPSTPDMTVDRMTQDALEVAEYARKHLAKQKIILAGHSWGSLLGLHVIKRQPEPFMAFFAAAQITSWKNTIEERERWSRQQAAAAGDAGAVKELDGVSSLPATDGRRMQATNKWVMSPSDSAWTNGRQAFLTSPPPERKQEAGDYMSGIMFSGEKLLPIITSFDARKLIVDFPIPYFVLQGRDDHMVSFEDAKAYVREVRAPSKAFIAMDGGHFGIFTNSDQFLDVIREKARRL